jgi:ribosome-binding protein aMBF1 (putative translation factor)
MKKTTITKEDLKSRSFEDIVADLSQNKAFQKSYAEEVVRRRLAKQIRSLRTAHQMTQRTMAQKSGMPQSVIARIESGDRGISVDTLGRVAYTLGKEVRLV